MAHDLGSAWDLANRGGNGKNGGRGGVIRLVSVIARAVQGFTRPGTARRVTYVLYDGDDPETSTYLNKDTLDSAVGSTITTMRDAGLIHPDRIVDGRSTVATPVAYADPAEFIQSFLNSLDEIYVHDRQGDQPRRIVIWTEAADTIPGLRARADKYGCMLVSSSGTNTDQQRMNLGRIMATEKRPITVLYVGDYDPPGVFMPTLIGTAIETWAARWSHYDIFLAAFRRQFPEKPRRVAEAEAYRLACQFFPRRLPGEAWHPPGIGFPEEERASWPEEMFYPPRFVDAEVVRVAIVHDDLARGDVTTTPAKRDQVQQYARWWPEGETQTLQVEALTIEEVEQRVEDAILDVLDLEVYEATVAGERDPREALRTALEGILDGLDEA